MSRNNDFSTSFVIVGVLEIIVGIGLIICAIIIGINAPQLLDYNPYGGPGNNGNAGGEPDIDDIAAPIASGAWAGVAAILLSCFAFASARTQSSGRLSCGMTFAILVCLLDLACIGIEAWGTEYMWDNKYTYSHNYGSWGQPFNEDLDNIMALLFDTHIATAVLAFLSLVIAIVHSTYCCRATCCGGNEQPSQKQRVVYQPYPVPVQPAANPDFDYHQSQHRQLATITSAPPYQNTPVGQPTQPPPAPQYYADPSAPAPTLNLQQQYEQQYNSILQPPPYNESLSMTSTVEKKGYESREI